MSKLYDAIALIIVLLILLLLFRVALCLHTQASAFTGQLPADLRI